MCDDSVRDKFEKWYSAMVMNFDSESLDKICLDLANSGEWGFIGRLIRIGKISDLVKLELDKLYREYLMSNCKS